MKQTHESDKEFEAFRIIKVTASADGGWSIARDDGWSYFVQPDSPVVPAVGDVCRFYGKGTGYPVRGLTLNGSVVFYRTDEEEREYSDHQAYGTVPQDVIDKWDTGGTVWSIEMGGLGPGYEQAIQVAAMEILRQMLTDSADASGWNEDGGMRAYSDTLYNKIGGKLSGLGLSGAQFGGAVNIAARIYKLGPLEFAKNIPADRKIQVSNRWPRILEEAA